MRILPDKNKQRVLLNIYFKEGKKVLLKTVQPVLARAEHVMPEDLKHQVRRLLQPEEVESYIETLWTHTGSTFAQDMIKRIQAKADNAYQLGFWDRIFRRYAAERSAKIVGRILSTEAENINRIIDQYVIQGESEGLGIAEIARNMRDGLANDVIGMQNYEAARIAQTEVIGSANRGSFEGAQSTGLELTKTWAHSGNYGPGYRPEHVAFGELGDMEMDYEYDTGLQFPGDGNADPGQTINCRCDIYFNDVN